MSMVSSTQHCPCLNGSHHHYTKHYTPLYVAEACKYNHRKDDNACRVFYQREGDGEKNLEEEFPSVDLAYDLAIQIRFNPPALG